MTVKELVNSYGVSLANYEVYEYPTEEDYREGRRYDPSRIVYSHHYECMRDTKILDKEVSEFEVLGQYDYTARACYYTDPVDFEIEYGSADEVVMCILIKSEFATE